MGKENTLVRKVWDFFASVKLAIIIFALISLTSIIGTVIPQQAEKAIKYLTETVGANTAPTVYNIFLKIGFVDMYHSWWYISILSLLALNIIVCSIDRWPGVLKIIKAPVRPLSKEQLDNMPIKRVISLNGTPDAIKSIVRNAFMKNGFNIAEAREDNGYQLYSQKGAWSRLGVYIAHISVLVILLGAITGALFSVESYISLPEGDISSVTYPIPDSGKTGPIALGFEVRCDNFEVEFYGNTETPKSFITQIAIIENGKEVLNKTVKVNDPLTYKGTTFYLSNYGISARRLRLGIFMFRITSKDGRSVDVNLSPGNILNIPNSSITGKIVNFSPALKHDDKGNLSTYTDKLHNPAVNIEFSDSGKKLYSSWILKRYPETSYLPDGNRVEFLDYWGVEYAFFRIRKDPGEWFIYIGLTSMGIGLLMAFFFSHRKIWAHVINEGTNVKVVIGATANKHKGAFEKKIDRMINNLGQTLIVENTE